MEVSASSRLATRGRGEVSPPKPSHPRRSCDPQSIHLWFQTPLCFSPSGTLLPN